MAIIFLRERAVTNAQAAYLALTQLLDHSNQLVLLLVNTLLSDMKSDNFVVGRIFYGWGLPPWQQFGQMRHIKFLS